MGDMKKKATDILEDYSYSYSQVDLETLTKFLEHIKSEAIKEFAERVFELFPSDKKYTTVSRFTIKQIVEEMTEGRKNDN